MENVRFVALNPISKKRLDQHRKHSHGLGLLEIGAKPVTTKLAIVAGGPSINDNVEKIKNFEGEVWAINEAFQWCLERNISATFYGFDPRKRIVKTCYGAKKAILADTVHPSVFKALSEADIELARTGKGEIEGWSTAASTAPEIAIKRGHTGITFFGCESSFETKSHAFGNNKQDRVWVECGGKEYMTTPQLVTQVELLSLLARSAPDFIKIESGGLLAAMIKNTDCRLTHVSKRIDERLKKDAA